MRLLAGSERCWRSLELLDLQVRHLWDQHADVPDVVLARVDEHERQATHRRVVLLLELDVQAVGCVQSARRHDAKVLPQLPRTAAAGRGAALALAFVGGVRAARLRALVLPRGLALGTSSRADAAEAAGGVGGAVAVVASFWGLASSACSGLEHAALALGGLLKLGSRVCAAFRLELQALGQGVVDLDAFCIHRHGEKDVVEEFLAVAQHHKQFARTLLQFDVLGLLQVLQHRHHRLLEVLWVRVQELRRRQEDDVLRRGPDALEVPDHAIELGLRRHVLRQKVAELADTIRCQLDECLVDHGPLAGQVLERLAGGVGLQTLLLLLAGAVLEARDHLHDPVPDLVGYRLRRALEHPEHHIDIPREVWRVPLGENRDLQDELLLQQRVADAQELQELIDDLLPVLGPAKRVQQVQRLSSDRDVGLVHLLQDQVFVPVQVLVHVRVDRKARHRLQAQVPDVRVRRRDERAQQAGRGPQRVGLAAVAKLDHQVHRLEQHAVLGVGAVLALRVGLAALLDRAPGRRGGPLGRRLREDAVQHRVDPLQGVRSEHLRREELQYSQQLGLQPRGGHVVVLVMVRALALHQVLQASADGRDDLGPFLDWVGAHLEDAEHEAADGGEQPDVAVAEHRGQLHAPDVGLQHLVILAIQPQEADARLPLDIRR
mmetsp:Transcript_16247/g.48311  ORF Transcript_16247/g.48311 Transcript_16247/m.48311 type:complete len:661 (-) Transcript_16247:668-2650(-)